GKVPHRHTVPEHPASRSARATRMIGRSPNAMSTAAARPSLIARWRQRLWRLEAADRGPMVLKHQRIYILPTRRGLALIATLAIMLLASMNYALSLGYALTFLVAG